MRSGQDLISSPPLYGPIPPAVGQYLRSQAGGNSSRASCQQQLERQLQHSRDIALQQLLTQSAIALAIMALAACGLGWWMAGRRAQGARRHDRRHADPAVCRLRGPATVRGERLPRAPDAADRAARRRRCGARRPLSHGQSLRVMAGRVRTATERHEHLIDSLLQLARSDRGVERYEPSDLADAARDALVTEALRIDTMRLRVTHRLLPAPLEGGRALLERLATNLIENAVHHNVPGGTIDVATSYEGTRATLCVANTGHIRPRAVDRGRDHQCSPGHLHGLRARQEGGFDVVVTLPVTATHMTAAAVRNQ